MHGGFWEPAEERRVLTDYGTMELDLTGRDRCREVIRAILDQ